MRLLHIVAGLPPDGGIAEAVPALCRHLQRKGHEVTLATVYGPLNESVQSAEEEGVRLVRFAPSRPRALYYSAAMRCGLGALAAQADLVHVHSCWTFPVWWGCHAARRAGKPYVISPHGCLDPVRLQRSSIRKRLAGVLFDRRNLRGAACVHATAVEEAEGFRQYGLRGPIAVVPLGIEADALAGGDAAAFVARVPQAAGQRVILFLSRLDPLKGLDLLVPAWGRVAQSFPGWHLVIAGPDERGYAAVVARLIREAGGDGRTTLCGALHGEERRDALGAAALGVLPTRHENFGLAVAESLAAGTPVITTTCAPWGCLVEQRCGWRVAARVDALASALREAMTLTDEERREMGRRGAELVQREYSWGRVAGDMARVYQWVLQLRPQPDCVQRPRQVTE